MSSRDETTAGPANEIAPTRRAVLSTLFVGTVGVVAACRDTNDVAQPNDPPEPAPAGSAPIGRVATSNPASSTIDVAPTSTAISAESAPQETNRPSRNFYLSQNFAPVPFETTALDLAAVGKLPTELRGTLYIVGPNPVAADPARYHWFLGDGLVHSFDFREGTVSYRSRWVRTDAWAESAHEAPVGAQPADPYPLPNGANTHVIAHGGRLLALYEAGLPTEIRADLSTVGRYDFDGALTVPMTAHPKLDARTGEMVFFGVELLEQPHLHYFVADAAGDVITTRQLDLPGPSMMHDFAITERSAVFIDVPVVYQPFDLPERPIPAAWDDDYETRIGVIRRDGVGDVRWFGIDPGYISHVLNAYEIDGIITLDAVRHSRFFDTDIYGVGEGSVTLDRWRIDLNADRLTHDVVDDRSQEMPRIDDRLIGRPHRYGYTVLTSQGNGQLSLGGLVKHDLRTGASQLASLPDAAQASEPVFVPRPGGSAEDDGWVLSVLYDPTVDLSSLVVIEAPNFAAGPVATVPLPVRVPHHFHGTFVDAQSVEA